MKRIYQLLILCFPLLLANCKTTKYTPTTFPEKQIIFGDGGGFSGVITEYTLLENGQFFKKTSLEKEHQELKRLKKKEAIKIYEQKESLRLHKFDINHPGNLYYFLRLTDEELDHTITWGAGDYNLREEIMDFYKVLRALIKTQAMDEESKKGDK
ncbi:MAG: hypothetical protein NXI23_10755 [Bacteroidetes bacterium]|jgi:hypothetical protein|nr:hypothetical protein [Bacteroidota bacterium]MDF1868307.1 hypothetical protein [Saprospiraceae bacterium]